MSTAEIPKENRQVILSEEHEETDEDEPLAVELSEINKKRPLILIEVVIFLYFFSLAITAPVLQFYLYQKFSEELGWNGRNSENYCSNSSQMTSSLEDKVQLKTNDYIMYFNFICNFLSFIPGLLFGNLTDKFGRKFVILLSVIGLFLKQISFVCIIYWNLQPELLFLSSTFQGLSGYYGLFLAAAFGMVADFTRDGKNRLLRVTTCEGSIAIGISLATVLSGISIKKLGFIWPAIFSLGMTTLSIIFACFFLPETRRPSSNVPVTCALFIRCFQFYVKDTPTKRRFKLIVCLICFLTTQAAGNGESNINILYLLNSPFCWAEDKITIFSGVFVLAKWIIVLTSVHFGRGWISEPSFVLIGVFSTAAGYLCKGIAWGNLLIYVGAAAGLLADIVSPMCKTIMSKAVDPDEQGAIFAGIGVLQMIISSLSGVFFSSIYKAALGVYEGLPFITMSGLALINTIFLIPLIIRLRHHPEQWEAVGYIQTIKVQAQTEINPVTADNKEKYSPFVSGVQFVLVSATMPRDLQNSIGTYLPVDSIKKVTTAGLNRVMPHVPQKFLRVLPSQKPEIILKLAKQQIERSMPSMIFCNDSPTSFFLMHLLEENGISCAIINGKMLEKNRHGVFDKFKDGHFDIMVATDVASRGLDTLHVQHVINYDFPLFVSDYIHRAGRVGRVGASHNGQVTSLVSHSCEVDVLWQIEIAARKLSEIHNVNANIKRKLEADFARRHGKPSDII